MKTDSERLRALVAYHEDNSETKSQVNVHAKYLLVSALGWINKIDSDDDPEKNDADDVTEFCWRTGRVTKLKLLIFICDLHQVWDFLIHTFACKCLELTQKLMPKISTAEQVALTFCLGGMTPAYILTTGKVHGWLLNWCRQMLKVSIHAKESSFETLKSHKKSKQQFSYRSQLSRDRADIRCYNCQSLGHIVFSCPTAWQTEGKTKGKLLYNCTDDVNNKELISFRMIVVRIYIAAFVDTVPRYRCSPQFFCQ